MILSDVVAEKFRVLLAEMPSWKNLTGSQFVNQLSLFLGWAMEDSAYKAERARHEAFIDTALNRSSILAHGEGMEFMPRKAVPAYGRAKITNSGQLPFTLVRETEFMSDAQRIFTLAETIIVPAGTTVEARIEQRTRESFYYNLTGGTPFQEIFISRDISPKVVSFNVLVAEDGENLVPWTYDRLLTNSYSDSLVYDEFYHFTDQIGVRFGNGDFGKIPPDGSIARIDCVLCDGDITLLEKQTLYPVDEVRDTSGEIASYEIAVSETVQNGSAQEGTEEMRRDLHYAPVYNDRVIWSNDYKYFLRRRYPDIVFCSVWGETESEQMWGYNLDHINRIWICAYSPEREIEALAMSDLRENITYMCRNFVWYPPEHVKFSVMVSGRVLKDAVISEVQQAIKSGLSLAYGHESRTRREEVRLHEIYEIIQDTGYFDKDSGAWFEVIINGQHKADFIYQMISIDLESSTFDFTYVS